MLNFYCERELPEGIWDLQMLSISWIRNNWNFSEGQASTFLMASLLPNSLCYLLSLCPATPVPPPGHLLQWAPWHSSRTLQDRICPKSSTVSVPPAWSTSCPFSTTFMPHTLYSFRSLLKRHFLRDIFSEKYPSSCFCSFSFLPFQFFFIALIYVCIFSPP